MNTFLKRFGKVTYGVALLAFLLPFFNITCESKKGGEGMTIATVSGLAMVYGGEMGGMITESDDEDMKIKDLSVDVEPFAIIAFLLVLVGLGLSFVNKPNLIPAHLGVAGLGLVSLIILYVQVTGQETENLMAGMGDGPGSDEVTIAIGSGFGFWTVAAILAFTIYAAMMAMKNPAT